MIKNCPHPQKTGSFILIGALVLTGILLLQPSTAKADSISLCAGESPLVGAAPAFIIAGTTLCEGSASSKSVKVELNDSGAGGGWNSLKADQNLQAGHNVEVGNAVTFSSNGGTGSLGIDADENAALILNGDAAGTAHTGVLITGGGQNGTAFDPNSGAVPSWADVSIQSKNYDETDPTKGSAIKITDYGVQIITPETVAGQNLKNSAFMNSGAGNMANNFGGNESSASGNIINNFGSNESTDPASTIENNVGGGSGVTVNNFGNGNAKSEINLKAANSTTTIQNGVNTSSLGGTGSSRTYGTGGSVLVPDVDTSSLNGAVLKDTQSTDTTDVNVAAVDANGKITIVKAGKTSETAVQQTTAMMTVTNGVGNTHGFIVNETQATMSGGINSSSMTLNDSGATFSNSATGAPIQVHGVYDGTAQFDAVNVRQLYGAVAASMATIPNFTVEPGETGIGIGTAMMGSYPAIGLSFAKKNKNGSQINIGLASAEHVPLAVRAGIGWVW